jgi:ADP-heptose:LPS heptosyltransferase
VNEPISKNQLIAIVSFEGSLEKLRACLKSLTSWVPQVVVALSEGEETIKQLANEFNVSVCSQRASSTQARWESGLNQNNSQWALLIRSNEIITGQLRKVIADKIKTKKDANCKYSLPKTMVFLNKRLKYTLDWYDSEPSCLIYIPHRTNSIAQLKKKHAELEGELIRYADDTLSECAQTVIKIAEGRASRLAQKKPDLNPKFIFIFGIISSIKIFIKTYFLRKGFKEGFEGIAFSVCDAHAELLGYLRYYELYIRGGKVICENPSSLKNILIIKLRDIGDNVLCTPLISNLKQHLPNASISILTWSYSIPIFEESPHVAHLFDLSKNSSSSDINKLCETLNSVNFDLVISTHSGGLASKILSKLKPTHKINNFYRGRNKFYNILTKESDYYRSSIERDLDCLRSIGLKPTTTKTEIFLSTEETTWARKTLIAKGLDLSKKIVLIHPTAAVAIKEWPLTKFNALIKNLNQKESIQSIITCVDSEYPKVKTLLHDMPDLVIFHQITVRQMMAIIHECDLVIDNDSSPSHIATALGVPTIVLFSQAIREIFRPYDEKKDHHFVFYNDVHCRECELTTCDNRICLEFSPDEVYLQALKMLSPDQN